MAKIMNPCSFAQIIRTSAGTIETRKTVWYLVGERR